jgi:predicted AlkP superfamily phosphohydrolase/phosphomutase
MLRSWRWIPVLLLATALNLGFAAEAVSRAWGPPEWRAAPDAERVPRFVVLGFDGVDPVILREYMDAGDLPAMKVLAERGGFHELQSEIPPESPVAWSSMLTGVGPGKHGIFDFVAPEPGYRAGNGMADLRPPRFLFGKVPVRPPVVRSRLDYPTFLQRVSAAGYPVLALRQPLLFPAPNMPGASSLSGLGTPDVAGSNGLYAIYQAGFGFSSTHTVFDGHRIRLEGPASARTYDTYLEGPFDPTGREADGGKRRLTVPLRFERGGRDDPITIRVGGNAVSVAAGQRSPWMRVAFTVPSWPAREVSARARFEVKSTDPLEVLSDPLQIDPSDPVLPISHPNAYSADLEARYGAYKTTGWMEQTFQLIDGSTSEAAFLKDLLEDMEHGEAVLRGELARGGRCVFYCFTQTDRAAHCFFWRRDPAHPLRKAMGMELAALPDPLRDVYRRMDRIVGGVAATLGPDDVLLVASDHGFQSWRRGMQVNQWLVNEGYLVPSTDDAGQAIDAEEKKLIDFFADRLRVHVDWSKSRAYAMGLGQIYVNRKGRETEGIVEDADLPALVAEIERKILAFKDVDGTHPVSKVYRLHEMPEYEGPHRKDAAEIQLAFRPGYRISWQTALLGGMRRGGPVCEDNLEAWSGDHCSTDRDQVPGILLTNRRLPLAPKDRPYNLKSIAASALSHFGLDGSDLDAPPLPLTP